MKIIGISIRRRESYEICADKRELFGTVRIAGATSYSNGTTIEVTLSDEQLAGVLGIVGVAVVDNMREATEQFAEEAKAQLAGPPVEAAAIEHQLES